eukprot:TCONS_00069688-protein
MLLGGSRTKAEIKTKNKADFRLKRVDITTQESISQIKFTYDDESIWCYGPDRGTKSNRPIILYEGEYLVRVSHERLYDYACAGALVEFETNKGRVFHYTPGNSWRGYATGWKSETTTVKVENGMEIISLVIKRGILIGVEQQPIVEKNEGQTKQKEWYVSCYSAGKEDIDLNHKDSKEKNEEVVFKHFDTKKEALKHWNELQRLVMKKKERGAMLVDCLSVKIVKQAGSEEIVKTCKEKAMEKGFYSKDESNQSIFKMIWLMYCTIMDTRDIFFFILSILLKSLNNLLDVHLQFIKGSILALLVSTFNSGPLEGDIYVKLTCDYVYDCDSEDPLSVGRALLLAGCIVKFASILLEIGELYIEENLNSCRKLQMKRNILEHVSKLDQAFYDVHSTSHVTESMSIESIYHLATESIPNMIQTVITILLNLFYIIKIDLYLGGFTVFISTFNTTFIVRKFITKLQKSYKFEWKWDSALSDIKSKFTDNLKTTKMFSSEGKHLNEYDQVNNECVSSLESKTVVLCFYVIFQEMTGFIAFAFSIYVFLGHLKEAKLTSAEITSFFFLMQTFSSHFNWFFSQDEYIRQDIRDLDKFIRLKNQVPGMIDGDEVIEDLKGEIIFEDVDFSYPSRPLEPVLKKFNLKIQPNKMTAIVGDSGAGKSTIGNLIMRLYDPTSGKITVDGRDMKSLCLQKLHEKMGIVTQNPDLMEGTLEENIGYGSVEDFCSRKDVERAAQLAKCDFIDKFRSGYDTYAGGSGMQLSGGQKQRLAIARAIIRNPKILVLDEATSSLDAKNEKEVQEALENVMDSQTVVVIAHRLSTIKNADNIVCMKDGTIVEQGTHDELMKTKGTYFDLISKQLVSAEQTKTSDESDKHESG